MLKPLNDKQTAFFYGSNASRCLYYSLILTVLLAAPPVFAQKAGSEPQTVSIQREAIALRHPRDYYVPLNLKPFRSLTISAPIDGIVYAVDVKPGDKPTSKAVLVRLESSIPQAEVARAQAALEVAKQEQKAATGKDAAIAKAKVELAEAELKIANIRLDQTNIRAPFEGEDFPNFRCPGRLRQSRGPPTGIGGYVQN